MPLWAFRYKFFNVHVFISPEYIPMSRIAMLYGYSMLNFLRTARLFPKVALPIYVPPDMCEG